MTTKLATTISFVIITLFASSYAEVTNNSKSYGCSDPDLSAWNPYCWTTQSSLYSDTVYTGAKRIIDTWVIIVIALGGIFTTIGVAICLCCMVPSCPLYKRRHPGQVFQQTTTVPAGTTVYYSNQNYPGRAIYVQGQATQQPGSYPGGETSNVNQFLENQNYRGMPSGPGAYPSQSTSNYYSNPAVYMNQQQASAGPQSGQWQTRY
ncbi:hypothetical protein L9F63_017768 [Diploptera punctata]|uniref:Uncharacterized protein n=1 Tax=Diploptera punctata TaxID=6984 RepID=A0AAD7ZY69_DIPPU|nr:hypothetical protein L9F63_017768 [Diploptera punctata]